MFQEAFQTAVCKRERQLSKICRTHSLAWNSCFVCACKDKGSGRDGDSCRFVGIPLSPIALRFSSSNSSLSPDFRFLEWKYNEERLSDPPTPAISFRPRDTTVIRPQMPQVFNRAMTTDIIREQLVRLLPSLVH